MRYTAIYKETRNSLYNDMTSNDYASKKAFEKDLRANGYMVVAILTNEQIKKIQDRDPETILKYSERVCEYIRDCV